VVDVPHIQAEFFFPGEIVAPIDLCPASDTRQDVMAAGLFGGVALDVMSEQRARADQAHFSAQDV